MVYRGSELSPYLFSIPMDKRTVDKYKERVLWYLMFADDAVLSRYEDEWFRMRTKTLLMEMD